VTVAATAQVVGSIVIPAWHGDHADGYRKTGTKVRFRYVRAGRRHSVTCATSACVFAGHGVTKPVSGARADGPAPTRAPGHDSSSLRRRDRPGGLGSGPEGLGVENLHRAEAGLGQGLTQALGVAGHDHDRLLGVQVLL